MKKPEIFVGSSSEGKEIAVQICKHLEKVAICHIWSENFFSLNTSTFDTLCKKAVGYDFAVFIATKDDKSTVRKKVYLTIRDNILFEYGLFTGSIGRQKTFIVLQNGAKLPTDLNGITVLKFKDEKDIETVCKVLISEINDEIKVSRISMLPSTSVAIAYFENFIRPLYKGLQNENAVKIDSTSRTFNFTCDKIEILIPLNLGHNLRETYKNMIRILALKKSEVQTQHRVLVTYTKEHADHFSIVDLPTGLNASAIAIELYTGKDCIGSTPLTSWLAQKERQNFIMTIKLLINRYPQMQNCVIFEEC